VATHPAGFEELIAEGAAVPVEGWDFSWFEGRATEERPSWGYAATVVERMAVSGAALDVQTGGGEILSWALRQMARHPAYLAATESWAPNLELALRNLGPFGVTVMAVADDAELPFPAATFDLVVSRHPVVTVWPEIARVLQPGGTYLSQQVGAGSNRELTDFIMGAQPVNDSRSPHRAVESATTAGFVVVEVRQESLRTVFNDVGAVVRFLRKVPWIVPGFTVDAYRNRLAALHAQIGRDGPFVAHAERFLIEALKAE
jgi:SAM-dependent methyltransferase